jgi:hypothetical protein
MVDTGDHPDAPSHEGHIRQRNIPLPSLASHDDSCGIGSNERSRAEKARARTGWLAVAGAGLVVAGLLAEALADDDSPVRRPVRGAQLAGWGAALLATSVLADSTIEHYKGSYQKPEMTIAPPAAAITLVTAVATALSSRLLRCKAAVFSAAIVTGLIGTGFHARNILRRPGGLTLNNVFYRAPFGAPAALALAGAGGVGAVLAQRASRPRKGSLRSYQSRLADAHVARTRVGTGMSWLTASGLFGLTAEVGLLHFRGAFHNPLMWAPIVCLPASAVAMLAAGEEPRLSSAGANRAAHWALGTTSFLAIAGTGLHAWGVGRGMGGWRNWTQNLFAGPPVAAPPSLAGIALLGFSALDLLRSQATGRAA